MSPRTLLITLAALAAVFPLHAQIVDYQIETDRIALPNSLTLHRENTSANGMNVTLWGGTAVNLEAALSALEFFHAATSPEEAAAALLTALHDPSVFRDGWAPLPVSDGLSINDAFDWRGNRADLSIGSYPVLFVASHGLESPGQAVDFASGSWVGMVMSTEGTVPSYGSMPVSFGRPGTNWNQALIGELNNPLTLAAIPEPRVYALLSGLAALALVLRRRSKAGRPR